MAILMLIGTQTGNTEVVAEAVAQHLADAGAEVHYVDLADAYPEMFADYTQLLIATSTWGDGELPDNALDFYDALTALQPDLAHLHYAILALGDHTYDPHFCAAAHLFSDALDALNAIKIYPDHQIDAGPGPRDLEIAKMWGLDVLKVFNARP